MPHSSGGGSHGGGSHSSSYSSRSSSSYSGGYSSGDSYNYSENPISRRPYPGATRYVYYDFRGGCHSLYQKGAANDSDLGTTLAVFVILSLIFIPVAWFAHSLGVYVPSKIDAASYNSEIIIDDHLSLLNVVSMSDALEAFKQETGVAPSLEVVKQSEWDEYYKDLETFAYSEYLRLFDDEKHWLFVISYPDDYKEQEFVDWKWEGMIGDDVYLAINTESENKFTTIIHKHMLRSEPESLTNQLVAAFNEYTPIVMEKQISVGCLIFVTIVLLIYIWLVIYFMNDYIVHKQIENSVRVGVNAKELECEYCGCMYIAGTISTCPHCGAAIPAQKTTAKKSRKN